MWPNPQGIVVFYTVWLYAVRIVLKIVLKTDALLTHEPGPV